MKYCTYCGSAMEDDANYCPNCGGEAYDAGAERPITEEPDDLDVGYRIVLFSRGTCSLKTTKEVLCDLLGYTTATVEDLLENMPVEIADELTELQAVTIAQVLAEYGMEITIVDEYNNYVDLSYKAQTSVFDDSGRMLDSALRTLATLSALNRVHRYRRYRKPSLLSLLFMPSYVRPRPVHVRRHINLDPEPRRRIVIQQKPSHYNTWQSSNHHRPQNSVWPSNRPQSNSKPQHTPKAQNSIKPNGLKPSAGFRPNSQKSAGLGNRLPGNVRRGISGGRKAPTGRNVKN
ncbi:MAG: zinc ribbon domain-containing protein [Erysipelotrichaceae bacterium]|nr:zinc ribbon domain-containing protein [Erysipelotrichaceae bacterium]